MEQLTVWRARKIIDLIKESNQKHGYKDDDLILMVSFQNHTKNGAKPEPSMFCFAPSHAGDGT